MAREHVDLRELRAAFARFEELPFPALTSDSDQLFELYDEVVMFDSRAAGLITAIAGAAPIWPYELKEDPELRARLAAHEHDADAAAAADARALLAYLDELDAVIVKAREAHARTRVKREPSDGRRGA
jgi:hypothetical protein